MKNAAANAIAALAKTPVESSNRFIHTEFSRDYFIPEASDSRLMTTLVPSIAKAAIQSGIAGVTITDWEEYIITLDKRS